MTKTFKNLLISCFVLLLVIIFAIVGLLLTGTESANAAADTGLYNQQSGEFEIGVDGEPADVCDMLLINNTVMESSANSGESDFPFPTWMYSFTAIPVLLLFWVFAKTKKGNLRRKIINLMAKEQLRYYGLSKKDRSVFKDKISSFSAMEVKERIRQNIERRKEERNRLQNRSNYNF